MSTVKDVYFPEECFANIDRNGPVPLYFQLSSRLEKAIRSGKIPAGARLENEISIGLRLGVSRPTVRRALQELVSAGILVRRRGIGTVVVGGQVTRQVELTSLYEDLRDGRHRPTTKVISNEVVAAGADIAKRLGLSPEDEVIHVRRLRAADGGPVAVLENYLPASIGNFTTADLEDRGLYELLRARGVTLRIAKQQMGARRASHEESDLLQIEHAAPVLTMKREAYDNTGSAIEFGHHCYRPDRYSFETTLVAR